MWSSLHLSRAECDRIEDRLFTKNKNVQTKHNKNVSNKKINKTPMAPSLSNANGENGDYMNYTFMLKETSGRIPRKTIPNADNENGDEIL